MQYVVSSLGFDKLCRHNFENYRDVLAFENKASIIGLFSKHYWTNFYICSEILKQAGVFCSHRVAYSTCMETEATSYRLTEANTCRLGVQVTDLN